MIQKGSQEKSRASLSHGLDFKGQESDQEKGDHDREKEDWMWIELLLFPFPSSLPSVCIHTEYVTFLLSLI